VRLKWTDDACLMPDEAHFYGKLQVRGQPDVEVIRAKNLPRELQDAGATIEIRVWPADADADQKPRLFVWEDGAARSAVTETTSSLKDAKLRAQAIVDEMLMRLRARQGARGYRGQV